MDDVGRVSFCCQRCWTPLRLDAGFICSVDEHTIAELSLPAIRTPELDYASQTSSLDNFIPGHQDHLSTHQGFTFVSHMIVGGNTNNIGHLSHYVRKSTRLFDLVSSTSDIDHPLCEDCSDSLLSLLEQQLSQAEEECQEYKYFLNKITKETEDENLSNLEVLEKELFCLQAEELELKSELKELVKKHEIITKEIEYEKEEENLVQEEEEKYWKSYSVHRNRQFQVLDEQISLECQLRFTRSNLDRLKQTNAFNAAFHLWHIGHFGTINGLRMGRLPSVPVDWAEINAAWGQVTILLSALARKINLVFHRYKLLPFGSQSCIEDIVENKVYPLYGSGGFRFLWDAKFDFGMVSFLDCLQQFQQKVEGGQKSEDDTGRLNFQFPYRMERGRIEDRATRQWYSIKIQFNSEEQWTKALKFMLTNLKWGVAWVAAQNSLPELL
uniref:EOG090X048D n=1 Tax=Ceriodaphnia reticulata TaxID=302197 RepID=A0A4Y7LZ79_9CRUS|nr:EOG090X048D [Ceriodaphnia reticulata]SVE72865.1 EOG090X048D [Ceriodaphnia reticulata]